MVVVEGSRVLAPNGIFGALLQKKKQHAPSIRHGHGHGHGHGVSLSFPCSGKLKKPPLLSTVSLKRINCVTNSSGFFRAEEEEQVRRPPPLHLESVEYEEQLTNSVHLIGKVASTIEYNTENGTINSSWTKLALSVDGDIMHVCLLFGKDLAETALEHLQFSDTIYVFGELSQIGVVGEDANSEALLKVKVKKLNFVEDPASMNLYPDRIKEEKRSKGFEEADAVKGYQVQTTTSSKESLWKDLLINPDNWYDNRNNKRNPKAPDFKHKHTGDALWIDSNSTPPWVVHQLEVVQSMAFAASTGKENLWMALVSSPSEWYDNRKSKKNPKAPDFKHKENGQALWIDSKSTPYWVDEALRKLAAEEFANRPLSENKWEVYFSDPSKWHDNRQSKRNEKAPDFRHKETGEGLWVDLKSTPDWILSKLKEEDSKNAFSESDYV